MLILTLNFYSAILGKQKSIKLKGLSEFGINSRKHSAIHPISIFQCGVPQSVSYWFYNNSLIRQKELYQKPIQQQNYQKIQVQSKTSKIAMVVGK